MNVTVGGFAKLARPIELQGGDMRAGTLLKITGVYGGVVNVEDRGGRGISCLPVADLKPAKLKQPAP